MLSLTDALITAALGYGVVFTGLIALMGVIIVFGKVMSANAKKAADNAKGGAKK